MQASGSRVIGIELSGDRLRLDASELSLAHLDVSKLEVHRCDNALVVDARLGSAKIGACTGHFRTSSSSFTNGIAQGTIESTGTYWSEMVLGAGVDTRMALEAGVLNRSLLCPNVLHLSVTGGTTVGCVDCRELPTPELRLCLATPMQPSDAGVSLTDYAANVDCPLFDEGLPLCP